MTTTETGEYWLSDSERAMAATMGELTFEAAHVLGSSRKDSSNQTCYTYREERIVVEHSERFNRLTVSVRLDEEMKTVYYAANDRRTDPDQFHPGRWMDYMYVLGSKAMARRAENARESARHRAEHYEHLYAPVDDAEIFEDVPRPEDIE